MILLVASSSASVEYLTGILGNAGFAIRVASSSHIVTQLVTTLELIILVSSKRSPQQIYSICLQIRINAPRLPIIVVGPEDTDAKVRLFGLGADDYIVEPFGLEEFLARVKVLIRRGHLGF